MLGKFAEYLFKNSLSFGHREAIDGARDCRSYVTFARYSCASFPPRGCALHPRIRRKRCAHLPHEERATEDVTFGPLCIRASQCVGLCLYM
jgi:hypothetical protein